MYICDILRAHFIIVSISLREHHAVDKCAKAICETCIQTLSSIVLAPCIDTAIHVCIHNSSLEEVSRYS